MRTGIPIAAIALFGEIFIAAAQPPVKRLDGSTISRAEIDATVSRLMSAAEVTGAGIAIFNRGRVAHLKTYGFRDKDKKLPLTEDSVMAGASFSKVAFAHLVMQIADDGDLDLDKPVEQYLPKPLPDYPAYGDLANDARYKKITARMLLSHTSGYDEWGRSLGHQQRNTADAAGSMQTTLRDFTRFMQATIEGERLRKSARELMLSPQIAISSQHQFPTLATSTSDENQAIRLSYGLGWGLYWSPYGKAFFKEGHDEGFRNYAVVFDQPRDGIVIMTNSSNGEGMFQELLETLLRNTFTPIEWEGFTPYNKLPPRKPLPVHTELALEPKLLDRLAGIDCRLIWS